MKLKLFFSSFFFYLPDLNKSTKKQTFFAAVGLDPGSRSWWVFLYLLILRKQRRRSSSSSWRESFTLKVRETQVRRRRRILFMHIHILCIWIIMWCCCCLAHEYIQMSSGGSTRQLIENVFFFSFSPLSPYLLLISLKNKHSTDSPCL